MIIEEVTVRVRRGGRGERRERREEGEERGGRGGRGGCDGLTLSNIVMHADIGLYLIAM